MYGLNQLKQEIAEPDRDRVACPVLGCQNTVVRQKKKDRMSKKNPMSNDRFYCGKHGIYISPTTWVYDNPKSNVLWDHEELKSHFKVKREHRIDNDNSEDAATWNVFRYLIKCGQLRAFLQEMIGKDTGKPVPCFWSYCDEAKNTYIPLKAARKEFGETNRGGSEPDLIISAGNVLFFVEAKLGAGNKTTPSKKDFPKKYVTGGGKLFSEIFVHGSSYKYIAEDEKRYELLRFWLLGSWMARRTPDTDFVLVNLVRKGFEEDIEKEFGKHIVQNDHRQFTRWTWEGIYEFIVRSCPESSDKNNILDYFRQKTMGYRPFGLDRKRIVKAFAV